jgi:hypothetical protein
MVGFTIYLLNWGGWAAIYKRTGALSKLKLESTNYTIISVMVLSITLLLVPLGVFNANAAISTGAVTTIVTPTNQYIIADHNIPATNSGTLLVVGVSYHGAGESITSIKWNGCGGTALTSAGVHASSGGGGGDKHTEIWYLQTPEAGTHNVCITFSDGGPDDVMAGAVTFTGVDTVTPVTANKNTNTGNTVTPTNTVAGTTASNIVFDTVYIDGNNKVLTVDASQTQKWQVDDGSKLGAASTETSGGGAVVMSWSLTGAHQWVSSAIEIKKGAGAISSGAATTVKTPTTQFIIADHNIPATDSGTLLVVGVSYDQNIAVTSIKWNGCGGTALTSAGVLASNGNNRHTEIWYLQMPEAGTHNVCITFSGSPTSVIAGAVAFTGVDTVTPIGNKNTNTDNAAPATVTVAGTTAGSVVFDTLFVDGNNAVAVSDGESSLWNTLDNNKRGAASTLTSAGDGVTTAWTGTTNKNWAISAIEIKASGEGVVQASPGGSGPTPPSLLGSSLQNIPDPFSINGLVFTVKGNIIDPPTQDLILNTPQTLVIKTNAGTGGNLVHMGIYFGPHPSDNIGNMVLGLIWDKDSGAEITDSQGFVSNVSITKTSTDGNIDVFTFTFTPVKQMPTSDMILRVWNVKLSSVDYHAFNIVKFTNEHLAPAPAQLPDNIKIYDNLADLNKQIELGGYVKPNILGHIHDTTSVFNDVPGKVYWLYDTENSSVTLVIEDGGGKVLDMQTESLVKQQSLTPNMLTDSRYNSLSRWNVDAMQSAQSDEAIKALNKMMQLYGRNYVVQYSFLG